MPPPESCDVAFKEWSGIVDALASGRQAILLRKGGIAEGAGGFAPEYPAFWLYPTRVHQAQQGLREEALGPPSPAPAEGFVDLRTLATVESIHYVERVEALERLAGEHAWTDETVRARFAYRRPGLWVLVTRIYVRPMPWSLAVSPEFEGCRSWVKLGEPLATEGAIAALDDAEFGRRLGRIREALAGDGTTVCGV